VPLQSPYAIAMPPPTGISPTAVSAAPATIACKWQFCDLFFEDAEALCVISSASELDLRPPSYAHCCDVHIGRKSSGNLNLSCRWEGCSVTCAKRDHITSHMRGALSSRQVRARLI
jgi:hypothetical protein